MPVARDERAVEADFARHPGRHDLQLGGEEVVSTSLAYENVIGMVESALDSPYVRRMKLLSKAL